MNTSIVPLYIVSLYLLLWGLVNAENNGTSKDNSNSSTSSSSSKRPPYVTDEQWLMRHLLRGYDPNTRPVYNASQPVNVYLGITLTQIFDLDEKNQVLTTNVWLDQQWTDQKLVWNPDDFFGIKKLRIPCRFIWKPDIVLYNSVEDYTDGYMQSLAMVSYDGTIFWPPIVKFQSTCQIDITYFPFDDQICRMKLGSWAYDGFQVDIFNRSVPVDLSNYISNGEWFLVSVTTQRNVVTYPCCPEPFPDVVFTIHLRRRTLYYTHNVIIPCVMLSGLTLLIFWMSPDSGEKVTLGLTVLLAFSVFMLLIAENMPATSNFVPLIGMYLTTVMGITSLSVVLAVVVSNIAHKGKNEIPIPACLHFVVIGLSRIMCVRLYYIRRNPATSNGRVFSPNTNHRLRRKLYQGNTANHASNDSACGLLEYELGGAVHFNKNGHSTQQMRTPASTNTSRPTAASSGNTTGTAANNNTSRGGGVGSGGGGGGGGREEDIDSVLTLLKSMLLNEADKDNREDLRLQWQEAAAIIDRFLFYVFLLLTIFVTLLTLVVLPFTKPEKPETPVL